MPRLLFCDLQQSHHQRDTYVADGGGRGHVYGIHIIVITLSRVGDKGNYAMLHILVVVVVVGGGEGGEACYVHAQPTITPSNTQLFQFH